MSNFSNFKNIFITLFIILILALSINAATIPMKKESSIVNLDTLPNQLMDKMDELINQRWPDLLDAGLTAYKPRMNIKETKDGYQIEAEVPGVKKENIELVLKDDYLIISGEKKAITEEEKDQYRRIERSMGAFYRKISMPRDIDKEKMSAELSDGILKIDIKKMKGVEHLEKKIILK